MRRATHISLGPSIKGLLIHIQFHLSGKKAIILHFKKKSAPLENNDYRPVALNSNIMKCLEKLMVGKLKSNIKGQLDPYQFAYKDNRGMDNALLTITHFI